MVKAKRWALLKKKLDKVELDEKLLLKQ